jgi:alkanesulfonate monooxygenase SsuD/methylene tetrahydromethanopterin reductase-like flavin-dependent oxidoreductase (luciferase family)
VRIGIGLPQQVRDVRPATIPAWAAKSEQAGFATLATFGRIAYPGVMDTVALAAAAAATNTIGLMSTVLIATAWPPTLLAKELASIDGISDGRLRLGVGIGVREDDFVVEGAGPRGLGKRLDHDLQVYRDVWGGKAVGGGPNAAVPAGTRQIPLLFGGMSPPALARMAKWGSGYVGPSVPAAMVATSFEHARTAWRKAGRDGEPHQVAIAYFALGDVDLGRKSIADYYAATPEYVDVVVSTVVGTSEGVRTVKAQFEEIGADELIFSPVTDSVDEVARLADIVC